jgi:hypothetical protein
MRQVTNTLQGRRVDHMQAIEVTQTCKGAKARGELTAPLFTLFNTSDRFLLLSI